MDHDDDDDDDEMIGADDCNTLTAGCDNTNKLIIKNSCDKSNTGKVENIFQFSTNQSKIYFLVFFRVDMS